MNIIQENNFEASPGGSSGTLNYSVGYGTTPGGGNNSQNPDKFGAGGSNKSSGHGDNENTSSVLSTFPENRNKKRKSSSGAPIHPGEMSDQGSFEKSSPSGDPESPNTVPFSSGGKLPQSGKSVVDFPGHGDSDGEDYYPNETPPGDSEKEDDFYPEGEPTGDDTNPNQSEVPGKSGDVSPGGKYQNAVANKDVNPDNKEFDKDVDQMFKKKITPTPDELMSALQYELNQMVKKDKYVAKSIVLKNLKQDPKYYSRLDMLNIDDDKMKVDESFGSSKIYKDRQGGEDVYWMDNSDSGGKTYIKSDRVREYLRKGYALIDLSKSSEDNGRLNKMEENKTTYEKTKSVLDEMVASKRKNMQKPAKNIKDIKEIDNIFKDLWNKRQGFDNRN
jgi:hypothetical protein